MATQGPSFRRVAGHLGFTWFCEGWRLFRRDSGVWLAIMVIWFVLTIVAGAIPYFGQLFAVVAPMFSGGLLLGCACVRKGGRLDVSHLFAAFQRRHGHLLLLGVANFAVQVLGGALAKALAVMMGAGPLLSMNFNVNNLQDLQALGQHIPALLVPAIPALIAWASVQLFVAAAISVALWFSPALIVFDGMDAWPAVRESWQVTGTNVYALTMWAVYLLLAFIVGWIPAAASMVAVYVFGAAWLLLAIPLTLATLLATALLITPLTLTGTYAAYRDMFGEVTVGRGEHA